MDVPKDIAAEAARLANISSVHEQAEAIAKALMAERDRCAACCHTALDPDNFVMTGPAGIARQIEAAIRRGAI